MNAKKIEAIRAALKAGLQIVLRTRDMSELMMALGIDGEWREVENHLPCKLIYSGGWFWLDGSANFEPEGELGGRPEAPWPGSWRPETAADLENARRCASAASAAPASGLPCEPQRLVKPSDSTHD